MVNCNFAQTTKFQRYINPVLSCLLGPGPSQGYSEDILLALKCHISSPTDLVSLNFSNPYPQSSNCQSKFAMFWFWLHSVLSENFSSIILPSTSKCCSNTLLKLNLLFTLSSIWRYTTKPLAYNWVVLTLPLGTIHPFAINNFTLS